MSQGEPSRRPGAPASLDDVRDAELSPQSPSGMLAAWAAEAGEWRRHVVGEPGTLQLWRLSWPIMLSQVLVTVVALIDVAMVGRLGAEHLAAVGYATQFFFMTQSALFAVGFACVALMARAIGAGDAATARRALAASVQVGVATATLVAALVLVFPREVLGVLNAAPAVVDLTIPYLRLVLASTLLLSVTLVLESGLRATRDTVTPMRIAFVVALVKVLLNVLLIFGTFGAPRLELIGAGVATVGSQVVGLLLFVLAVRRQPVDSPMAFSRADLAHAGSLRREVLHLAAPGVGERLLLNLALLAYFALLGGYGTIAVAAYTVGVRALSFSWIPGTGFAAAVATLVGHALGRGDAEGAVRVGRQAIALALLVAMVFGVIGGLGREAIARAFTDDPEIVGVLGTFMLCLAIAQPMLQLHFTIAGVHRGAGDTWTPLFAAAVGNWGLRVPLAAIAALVLHLDLAWLWAALIFDHAARATWLLVAFRAGGWRRRRLASG